MDTNRDDMLQPGKSGRNHLNATSAPNIRSSSLLSTTLLRDKLLRVEIVKGKSVIQRDHVCRGKLMWEIGAAKFKRSLMLVLVAKGDKKTKDVNLDMAELRAITACDRFPSETAAAFSMHFRKKVYHGVADNEDDMLGWVAAIQAALEESRVQEGPPLLYHVTVIDSPGNTSQGERLMEFSPRWQPHSLVFRSPLNQVVVYSCGIANIKLFGYSSRTGHVWLKTMDGSQIVLHINGVTAAHVARVLRIYVQETLGDLDVNDQMDSSDRITYTVAGSSDSAFYTPTVVLQCSTEKTPVRKLSKANTIPSYSTAEFNGVYEAMDDVVQNVNKGADTAQEQSVYEKMDGDSALFLSDRDQLYAQPSDETAEDVYDNTVPLSVSAPSMEYDHLSQPHLSGYGDASLPLCTNKWLVRAQSSSPNLDTQYDRLFAHLDEEDVDVPPSESSLDTPAATKTQLPDASAQALSPFHRMGGRRVGSRKKSLSAPRHRSSVPILKDQLGSLPSRTQGKPALPGEDSDNESQDQPSTSANQHQQGHQETMPYSPYEVAYDEPYIKQAQRDKTGSCSLSRRTCSESNLAIISLAEDGEYYVLPEVPKHKYKPRALRPPAVHADVPPVRPPKPRPSDTIPGLFNTANPSSVQHTDVLVGDAVVSPMQKYSHATLGNWLPAPSSSYMQRARSDSDLSKEPKDDDHYLSVPPPRMERDDQSPSPGSEDDYINHRFHFVRSRSPPSHMHTTPISKESRLAGTDGSPPDGSPPDGEDSTERATAGDMFPTPVLSPPVPKPRKLSRSTSHTRTPSVTSPPPPSPKPDVKAPKKSPRRSKQTPPSNDTWQSSQVESRQRELQNLHGVSVAEKAQFLASHLDAGMFTRSDKGLRTPSPHHNRTAGN